MPFYAIFCLRLESHRPGFAHGENAHSICYQWPLPRKTQLFLAKVIRKACKKFAIEPCFMTALASVPNRDLPKVFEAYRPDCYIVRRSIVQNEVIFSGEGLTLLSIDNIYTFKQLLCTLSKRDWVANARDVCLSSCVHLLHRINEVYTNPKLSRGYLARVYKEVEFKQKEFDEVTSDHNGNYCTASIKDVTTLEPDYTALSDIAFDWKSEDEDASAVELPDTSILVSTLPTSTLGILRTRDMTYGAYALETILCPKPGLQRATLTRQPRRTRAAPRAMN